MRSLIRTFLEKIAVCSMCKGAKTFPNSRTVQLDYEGLGHRQIPIPAGTELDCFKCAGTGYDPEFRGVALPSRKAVRITARAPSARTATHGRRTPIVGTG